MKAKPAALCWQTKVSCGFVCVATALYEPVKTDSRLHISNYVPNLIWMPMSPLSLLSPVTHDASSPSLGLWSYRSQCLWPWNNVLGVRADKEQRRIRVMHRVVVSLTSLSTVNTFTEAVSSSLQARTIVTIIVSSLDLSLS